MTVSLQTSYHQELLHHGSACCQLMRSEGGLPGREAAVVLETSLRCVLYAAESRPASVCHVPAAAPATLSPTADTAAVQ